MKIVENRKVLFKGKFDVSKLNFKDSNNSFDGEQQLVGYIDADVLSGLDKALYDFMTRQGWNGNDNEKTLLYISIDYTGASDYSIMAWCKPILFVASDFETEHSEECLAEQEDKLKELEDDGGYEMATFDLQLEDSEKVDLLKSLKMMAA